MDKYEPPCGSQYFCVLESKSPAYGAVALVEGRNTDQQTKEQEKFG